MANNNDTNSSMAEDNGAMKISEIMADFMQPNQSSDHEILQVVAKYSLQIRPDQQFILNRLFVLTMDKRIPEKQRNTIKEFIKNYETSKRYHDTMPYIGRTVEALALRRFWSQESMKGIIQKQ